MKKSMKGLCLSVLMVSVLFNLYHSSTIMEILTCTIILFSFYHHKKPTDKMYSRRILNIYFCQDVFQMVQRYNKILQNLLTLILDNNAQKACKLNTIFLALIYGCSPCIYYYTNIMYFRFSKQL